MTAIFINYRRSEAYAAALLDERLSHTFGSTNIFRASRSIVAGENYEIAIGRAVEQCEVMLVVVGEEWAQKFEDRAGKENDWTLREIEYALKRDIPTIPLLLSGAEAVDEDDVPASIAKIAKAQYLRFDYRNFEQDVTKIAIELRRTIPKLAERRLPTRFGLTRIFRPRDTQ